MAERDVPMSIRRLIFEVDPKSLNVTEFCGEHGVSTWFFYDLRTRYDVDGRTVARMAGSHSSSR